MQKSLRRGTGVVREAALGVSVAAQIGICHEPVFAVAIEVIEPKHGMGVGTAEGGTGVSDVSGIKVPAQVYGAVFGLI